ncbi:carboxylesterase family protein [Nocardia sp. NPDC051030]|uniref:carboxylesterase/lipase family protein n=1 Tax=Nocardia sp. NPDC051030 TaxID=3155162 RepID=UPI0034137131
MLIACAASVLVVSKSDRDVRATLPLTVRLDAGQIRGTDTAFAHVFYGIRYAEPPIGELRWRDPVPVRPWSGVFEASQLGQRCTQLHDGKTSGSEDCLTLNVTTPQTKTGAALPVLVWLHGGGYLYGSGGDYDAQRLADQGNVIVVTVNYRLGVFGYFGLPGLAGSGDFGLADQLQALRWTKRNIAAFGGDSGNVTLSGESAGGMSACALLTSPAAAGLIDKAIIQSGSCLLKWLSGTYVQKLGLPTFTPYSEVSQTQATGQAAATELGCAAGSELACMRAKPADDLMPVNDRFASNLAWGTPLLPADPAKALQAGDFPHIPIMSGGTRDEARAFISGAIQHGLPVTAENYPDLMRGAFGDKANQVMAAYPLADYRSPALAWATVSTDAAWSCPTLAADKAMAARTPVYAYDFADDHAPNVNLIPADFPPGAAHASELPYLFDLIGRTANFTWDQWQLAGKMIAYWSTFAREGTPTAPKSPRWPRFEASEAALSLAPDPDGISRFDYRAAHHCTLFLGPP